jgi:hypothetical protein
MILEILKGPCWRGASLAVPYGRGRFFPSSHTACLVLHVVVGVPDLYATLLSMWIAISLLRHILDRYSSAVRFFNSAHWSAARGGSQPISNLLGAKPVVEFLLLLWMADAMGSHLLHSFWLTMMRCRYCLTHWFVHSDRLSVWG